MLPKKSMAADFRSQKPAQRYDGIILQVKKQGMQRILSVFTRQDGLCWVSLPRRGRSRQGFGACMALSRLTFDAVIQGDMLALREYDIVSNPGMADLTWDRYVYSQIFVEMVHLLFPQHQRDDGAYGLLCRYCQEISRKNARVLTIIAGWQLVSLAGFCPDAASVPVYTLAVRDKRRLYYVGDVPPPEGTLLSVPLSVRQLWQTFLSYAWGTEQTLRLPARGLAFLEELLYSYVEQCSDRPMRSLVIL